MREEENTVVFRMKDGYEIKVECKNCRVTTHKVTGNILSYEIEGIVRKGTIPLYMPVENIALIYQVVDDNESSQLPKLSLF